MKNFLMALAQFQRECPSLNLDSVGGKSERSKYTYRYMSLGNIKGTIQPAMTAAGLVFYSLPTGENSLRAYLYHAESGEGVETEFTMRPERGGPQGVGSVLSYMRRYALVSMLDLVAETDDDGQAAMGKAPAGGKTQKPPQVALLPEGRMSDDLLKAGEWDGTIQGDTIRLKGKSGAFRAWRLGDKDLEYVRQAMAKK
jgi:hypothetical protein